MMAVSPPVKSQWFEQPLMMPLRDIVKEYREAKYPKKMIDILADENHTKPCRIAWLLDRCGEVVDKVKLPRKPQRADAPDLDMVWRDTPLGAEAAQINFERKQRIMEEENMHRETDTECPVEAEDNSLAWVEKALESEPSDEENAKKQEFFGETALPEKKSIVVGGAAPDKVCPKAQANLAELITAEFWQIYLSHTFRPVNDADVAAMLTLANIAERLAE